MADKSKSPRRWPTADILRRAEFLKEAGPIRFCGYRICCPASCLGGAHAGVLPLPWRGACLPQVRQIRPLCSRRPRLLGGKVPAGDHRLAGAPSLVPSLVPLDKT